MNLQIAATLGGRVAAIGPDPVHGARHDAHTFEASTWPGITEITRTLQAICHDRTRMLSLLPL